MASRMKKMFHRKKNESNEELNHHTRTPAAARSDPAMRTSLYESTTEGGLPQTGDYPLRGNDSSVVLQGGRKPSVRSLRSRRSSSRGSQQNIPLQAPSPTQHDASRMNPRFAPQASNATGAGSYHAYQNPALPTRNQEDQRKRWSRSPLPQEFADLSIGDSQSPTIVTQTVTTTTRTGYQGQYGNRVAPQAQIAPNQNYSAKIRAPNADALPQDPYITKGAKKAEGYGTRSNPNPRALDQLDGQHPSASKPYRDNAPNASTFDAHSTPEGYGEYDADLARQKSISRKQVGTSAQVPHSSPKSSAIPSTQFNYNRQQSASKSLQSTPVSSNNGIEHHTPERVSEPGSILERSRPITRGPFQPRDAKDVVNRAKGNTYDTEVIEKIAPAVVHENISKDVHHIREEVITREVHNHDYYHRMLPVVDVEVLPPRHFLPVEGGGLVEVSASEVPGRGNNWVIAETASKIPSDQAAPRGARRFTAREFPGQEGDAVRYQAPEGHERTEQTWVHPPELEDGARLTGQSWPMVFGDDTPGKEVLSQSTPKSAKRRSPKKGNALHANPAQRADGLGRMV